MVEDGELTMQEAYVVATIDRFVNARKEGCWASNDRLGKHCGISGERMRSIIRKLVSVGLVFRVRSSEHERVLETKFSRAAAKKRKKANNY
jgi:DNA-binding MarR family transcriptional regulator